MTLPKTPDRPATSFRWWLAAGVLLVNLLVVYLAGQFLVASRQQFHQQAAVTTRNLSDLLAAYTKGLFARIDGSLFALGEECQRQFEAGPVDAVRLNVYIRRQYGELTYVDGVRVADATGQVRYGVGYVAGTRVSLADRNYFRRLRDHPGLGMVISEPVIGRFTQQWELVLARRINHTDGSFAGMVYATLRLDRYTQFLASLEVGRQGVISLRSEDSGMIARYPAPHGAGPTVGSKASSPSLLKLLQSGVASGTYATAEAFDRVPRTYSFRKLEGFPLYVIVGLSSGEYLAPWRTMLARTEAALAAFLLITLTMAWLLHQRWQRQAVLALAMGRQRTILDNLHSGVVLVSEQGVVESVNPFFCQALGLSERPEAIRGMTSEQVMALMEPHVVDPEGVAAQVRTARAGGVLRAGERVKLRNGKTFIRDFIPIVLDGVPSGRVWTFWEVTELEALHQSLEERTRQAEIASVAKSEFLANMSHEIRTPMNGIIGLSHLMLRTDLTERQRDYAARILNASRQLLRILNDILDFSKGEAGKLELETSAFAVRQVMEEVHQFVAERAGEKGLRLDFEVAPEVPERVMGDALRLGQVLLNLASNAVKFTERGRVAVTASLQAQEAEGVVLRFQIEDTGVGIAPEALPRLFQSFSQANSSITRAYGGSGLGLAISRRLVGLMGGRIEVASEPGRGSTFTFTVALGVAAEVPDPAAEAGGADPAFGGRVLKAEAPETCPSVARELLDAEREQVVPLFRSLDQKLRRRQLSARSEAERLRGLLGDEAPLPELQACLGRMEFKRSHELLTALAERLNLTLD